jgi:hypothetical protein
MNTKNKEKLRNTKAFKVFDFFVGVFIFSYAIYQMIFDGYSATRVFVMLCGIAWMGVSYANRNSAIDNKFKGKISGHDAAKGE